MEAYDKRVALKTILLAQLFIESLDEMKGTTLFKQGTKNLINRVDRELSPLVEKHYNKVYSEDVLNSIDVIDSVVDEIVHDALIDIEGVTPYNLFIVKGTNGKETRIKTTLTPGEFEKQYKAKVK